MKKQIITAGIAAALVLGTAPAAFAAEGAEEQIETGSISQGTTIKVATSVDNIDVTVPLALVVTGPVTGGGLTVAPDNTAYKIVNNSTKFGVKVTEIEGKVQDGWKLSLDPLPPQTVPEGAVGDICLQLKTAAQDTKPDVLTITGKVQKAGWSVTKKDATGVDKAAGVLGIDIVKDGAFNEPTYKGSSIAVSSLITGEPSSAVKIVYTVEIDTNTGA